MRCVRSAGRRIAVAIKVGIALASAVRVRTMIVILPSMTRLAWFSKIMSQFVSGRRVLERSVAALEPGRELRRRFKPRAEGQRRREPLAAEASGVEPPQAGGGSEEANEPRTLPDCLRPPPRPDGKGGARAGLDTCDHPGGQAGTLTLNIGLDESEINRVQPKDPRIVKRHYRYFCV